MADWELILVDDGSPDRCGEICEEYARRDSRIKVIHKQNAGVAAARNTGVAQAQGRYITFVDGDDFLHPEALERLLSLAEEYEADLVQCDYVRGAEVTFPTFNGREVITHYTSQSVFAADQAKIIVWGKLYKADLLKAIPIPEGRYFEDDLVTWKWYYAAQKIVVTSRPLYYYTCNGESVMAQHQRKPNFSYIDAYDEREDFFRSTGELDMEVYSHRQLCKSLLLVYANPHLTAEQRTMVRQRFARSWKVMRPTSYLPLTFKLLFTSFSVCPSMISKLLNCIR